MEQILIDNIVAMNCIDLCEDIKKIFKIREKFYDIFDIKYFGIDDNKIPRAIIVWKIKQEWKLDNIKNEALEKCTITFF